MKTKTLLICMLLITPIVANADNHIGAIGNGDIREGNVDIATDYPYYIKAEILPGDSTTVVSASYVKGAYNDAIAAVNKVIDVSDAAYQIKLESNINGQEFEIEYEVRQNVTNEPDRLVSSRGIKNAIEARRVSAVTTWGDDTPTKLELVNQ